MPILAVIGLAGVTGQGTLPSTLESKRTVMSRAMMPLALPVATAGGAAIAGGLAKELVERHRGIGGADHGDGEQEQQAADVAVLLFGGRMRKRGVGHQRSRW